MKVTNLGMINLLNLEESNLCVSLCVCVCVCVQSAEMSQKNKHTLAPFMFPQKQSSTEIWSHLSHLQFRETQLTEAWKEWKCSSWPDISKIWMKTCKMRFSLNKYPADLWMEYYILFPLEATLFTQCFSPWY